MNGYNFTDRVRTVLQMAREEAARLHHEYVGTEHILLGLIREGGGVAVVALTNLMVDLEELSAAIHDTVKQGKASVTRVDLPYTSRAKKILELSMAAVRELNHTYVGTEHLLLGLLLEAKGIAAQTLQDFGVTTELARAEILRVLGSDQVSAIVREFPWHVDQAFKTAIALIELHHRRRGSYPDSLDELQFVGHSDTSLFRWVRYEKLPDGYALDLVTWKGGKPELSHPPEFWHGLGIRRTNVEGLPSP